MRRVVPDDDASLDEEELQELQVTQITRPRIRRQTGRLMHWLDDKHCGREGHLEIVLPLAVLACLALGVVVYNLLRFRRVDICDEGKPMAKHFYCFNQSASPGVHLDHKVR